MQGTSNVGSAGQDGLQGTPVLERLRPFQIATRLLPTAPVTVLEASDAQFQAFVDAHDLHIEDGEAGVWSFDDRCRLINHGRKHGLDLFVLPNKNSSAQPTETIPNNSPTEQNPNCLESAQSALVDIPDAPILSGWFNIIRGELHK